MNGSRILDMTRAHLARFVSFPSQAALDVSVLWAAHSHCRTTAGRLAFSTTPRLLFLSDLAGSGKTAAMDRVTSMCFNPRTVIDPTPLSLATLIDEARPTIAFDECDCAFGNGAAKQQVRSILNAGYKQTGAEFSRGRGTPINIFGPVAMAGLGQRIRVAAELAPLRSRSLIIEMQPAVPPEEYWPADHGALTANYREMLTAWCKRNLQTILAQRPTAPTGIEGRAKEIMYPLLQIAAVAGGTWPERAADAARQILLGEASESAPDELNLYERLLLDLRSIYTEAGTDRLPTRDIVDGLYSLPASTWSKMWPTRTKAPRELAAILAPLGVESMTIRTGTGPNDTARGYHREGLENLWDEILSETDDTSAITPTITLDDTFDLDENEIEDSLVG